MNTQLSTTDTRTADRTSEQLAAIADHAQAERDAQTLARELFEARREIARLTRELSRIRAALAERDELIAAVQDENLRLQEQIAAAQNLGQLQ